VVADTRFAMRTFRRNPLLATTAILTLALGIGANTAIFSVVNRVILRPLPFPSPDQLMMLAEDNAERDGISRLPRRQLSRLAGAGAGLCRRCSV
jgi:hypothetical protein